MGAFAKWPDNIVVSKEKAAFFKELQLGTLELDEKNQTVV